MILFFIAQTNTYQQKCNGNILNEAANENKSVNVDKNIVMEHDGTAKTSWIF